MYSYAQLLLLLLLLVLRQYFAMADLNTDDFVRIDYKILVDGTNVEVELPPEWLQLIPKTVESVYYISDAQ